MPASVTPEYLLEGAACALEQCGLLLRDANVRWLRLSEQNFRVDKWSLCRG